jgi:hypothetical protein
MVLISLLTPLLAILETMLILDAVAFCSGPAPFGGRRNCSAYVNVVIKGDPFA